MLQACFSKATLVGFGVVMLVLLVEGAENTREKTVLVILTCAFYLLFKSFGVLVITAANLSIGSIQTHTELSTNVVLTMGFIWQKMYDGKYDLRLSSGFSLGQSSSFRSTQVQL